MKKRLKSAIKEINKRVKSNEMKKKKINKNKINLERKWHDILILLLFI